MRKSAVMLALVRHESEWCVLFEVRAKHLKRQPGEICFPGGRVDPGDRSAEETAIRETSEELGIERGLIKVIGALDILVTPFQEMIHPYVCTIAEHAILTPNPDEVEEVFYVPLHVLKQESFERHDVYLKVEPPEDFPFERIPRGKYYNWSKGTMPEYFVSYQGRTIWGLTARILHNFLEIAGGEIRDA
ncbi:NUDIX hydrolase [Collibacillus ludicampi]|uniref:NUDIX hydrolase n=1 Tax=Collibacillus ludicampi TaxID=2771369 RepID=UPI002493DBB3|nr:CoA pyrophosphatase [Collibacillus ludicampi]